MRTLQAAWRFSLAAGLVLGCCCTTVAAAAATGAAGPDCSRYAVRGIAPGMSFSDVRKRMGAGDAVELVRGPAGPQTGVTYSRGDLLVYVLYDRDVSSDSAGQVVVVRAHGPAGLADPVGFVRSVVPDLGEPVLGREHLDDGFEHGAAVWEDADCDVEISAYRRQAEWWQPGKGDVFVQIISSRFADAEAARAEGVAAPRAPADAPPAPQAQAPQELTVTLDASPVAGPVEATPAEASSPVRIADSYVAPVYPDLALRMGVQASVRLRVQVKSDGSVGEVGVLEATRKGMGFEQAAIDAVKRWRYQPAARGGQPEEAVIEVRLTFGLKR